MEPRGFGRRLSGNLTDIRAATENDADLLVEWHLDPEVAKYWDDETFTREEMLRRLCRTDVDSYIVEARGTPVGYIQVWFGESPEACGVDMFLIPTARGRGYGPDAARALVRSLLIDGHRPRVTVDPYASNERAVRAWSKAGFRPIELRPPDDEHRATWLLMEIDESSFESASRE